MYRLRLKRLLDMIAALAALPALFLLSPVVAVAVKLDDQGPVFFRSPRLGRYMVEFSMLKFRTMCVDAEDLRNQDGSTFNSTTDSRVTRIGRFLRTASIDELPQIINVLRGEMSFVGPRPSPLGNEASYPPEYIRKFDVLPGITGYSQSLRRNSATIQQRREDDLFYVEHLSFRTDLVVVVRTLNTVLRRRNINTGDPS